MTSPTLNLVIDARPRGPRGLLAAEVVLGRPVLSRLVDQALEAIGPGARLGVRCLAGDRDELAPLLAAAGDERVELTTAETAADAPMLRTDRLYDSRRLRRALRPGGKPEAAVIWRLDRPEALEAAEQELTRRLTYQPLGRYWAFPIAERLAASLAPTRVRPNAVTLAAAGLMFLGIALIAVGETGWLGRATAAIAFAAALVLDTADGRLARLQGTRSEFGRWLDEVLDELADLALHAAIAWTMFQQTGSAHWLALGMLYASGKYMFVIQSAGWPGFAPNPGTRAQASPPGFGDEPGPPNPPPLRRCVAALGHADLRWHLWIALALVGRLDVALGVYAFYFPLRAAAGIARKGVARG